MKLLCFILNAALAQKYFLSGPSKCLFKTKGHYFCGSVDGTGYCCPDSIEGVKECSGDLCTPKSENRSKDPSLKALYMSYSTNRTKICSNSEVILNAYTTPKVVSFVDGPQEWQSCYYQVSLSKNMQPELSHIQVRILADKNTSVYVF